MGRLPALNGQGERRRPLLRWGALALVALAGCDKGSAGSNVSRSEQVLATGSATADPAAAAPVHSAPAPRAHKLCEGDGNAKGRTLPKTPASHAEAPGAPRLDGTLPAAHGAWTWVNLWASWCGPCKEETPRLLGWRDRLEKAGSPIHLVFVSLDDDDRQLNAFLGAQPEGGLRSTLWLPDGPARASWLSALKMKSAPELPEQALVDPDGRVRCFVEGAVEDGDYAEIAALVSH